MSTCNYSQMYCAQFSVLDLTFDDKHKFQPHVLLWFVLQSAFDLFLLRGWNTIYSYMIDMSLIAMDGSFLCFRFINIFSLLLVLHMYYLCCELIRSFDWWFSSWQSLTFPVYITLHTVEVLFAFSRVLIYFLQIVGCWCFSGPLQITHITFAVIEAFRIRSLRLKVTSRDFLIVCYATF